MAKDKQACDYSKVLDIEKLWQLLQEASPNRLQEESWLGFNIRLYKTRDGKIMANNINFNQVPNA